MRKSSIEAGLPPDARFYSAETDLDDIVSIWMLFGKFSSFGAASRLVAINLLNVSLMLVEVVDSKLCSLIRLRKADLLFSLGFSSENVCLIFSALFRTTMGKCCRLRLSHSR